MIVCTFLLFLLLYSIVTFTVERGEREECNKDLRLLLKGGKKKLTKERESCRPTSAVATLGSSTICRRRQSIRPGLRGGGPSGDRPQMAMTFNTLFSFSLSLTHRHTPFLGLCVSLLYCFLLPKLHQQTLRWSGTAGGAQAVSASLAV